MGSPLSHSSTVAELDNEVHAEGSKAVKLSPNKPHASELQSPRTSDISSSYSFLQGTIVILQVIYASFTLFKTRGDQIDRYGFTAFGLIVAPYLVMSIVNLLGTILTPTYSTAFLVESEIMDEARRRGGYFRGAVGRLAMPKPAPQSFDAMFKFDKRERIIISEVDSDSGASDTLETNEELLVVPSSLDGPDEGLLAVSSNLGGSLIVVPGCNDSLGAKPSSTNSTMLDKLRHKMAHTAFFISGVTIGSLPIFINGYFSHFDPRKSTGMQQLWMFFWMCSGMFSSGIVSWLGDLFTVIIYQPAGLRVVTFIFFVMVLNISCGIGVFITVAQMILEFGSCVQIYGGI